MRALVIGGTGPTGPHVVNGLVARGWTTTILHTGRHEVDTIGPEVEHIHTDPFDREATEAALGGREFDLVVAMYGRLRMLAPLFAGRCGRFLSVGGAPVYAGFGRPDLVYPPGMIVPTREDAPLAGPDDVEKVQRIVETEAVVFEHHPQATHLRYPRLYGPGQLAPREWPIVRRILDGREVIIVPDGGLCLRTSAYGPNAAHALLCCVDHGEASAAKAYNVGDEIVFTQEQLVVLIADALGAAVEILKVPLEFAPHTRSLLATHSSTHRVTDVAALRHDVGYRDLVDPRVGVAETARWLAANPLEAGSTAERILQDPFDYEWEDRLIATWGQVRALLAPVVDAYPSGFRDMYADGRRHETPA